MEETGYRAKELIPVVSVPLTPDFTALAKQEMEQRVEQYPHCGIPDRQRRSEYRALFLTGHQEQRLPAMPASVCAPFIRKERL